MDVIPIRVIINDNPLDETKTYGITFMHKLSQRPIKVGQGNVNYIISELQAKGRYINDKESARALQALLVEYEDTGLAEINNRIPQSGYYWVDNRIVGYDITQRNIDLSGNDPDSRQKILECIKVIEGLYERSKDKSILVTTLKWGAVAPFGYAKKCMDVVGDNWVPDLHCHGRTRAGKNTKGKIALAISRKHYPKDEHIHFIGFNHANSEAKFARIIGITTYPIIINEVGALSLDKFFYLVELIKHTVESKNARGKHNENRRYVFDPALSSLMLTGNPAPPVDPAYKIRVIPMEFYKEYDTSDEEKEEFNEWFYTQENIEKLGVIGDVSAKLIMENPELLRKSSWSDLGKYILERLYMSVNKPIPEWTNLLEKPNIIEQSAESTYFELRGFFNRVIIDNYRKDPIIERDSDGRIIYNDKIGLEQKLNQCVTKKLIEYLHQRDDGTIIITHDIIQELQRNKITNVTTMQSLAEEIPGFVYKNMKVNGKVMRVVSGSYDDFLISFLNCKFEEDEELKI
jgi:hypothetical protein